MASSYRLKLLSVCTTLREARQHNSINMHALAELNNIHTKCYVVLQSYSYVVLQYYSYVVLQSYSYVVLQSYSCVVLQSYSYVVLQSYSYLVLQYYSCRRVANVFFAAFLIVRKVVTYKQTSTKCKQ